MRGSKAKRLHWLRGQLAVAGLSVPAKARRVPAWLARYQIAPGPSVAAPPAASPHRRATPQNPRPHRGSLKAKGRTAGPSEKARQRQKRRDHEQQRRWQPAFIDDQVPTVKVAGGVL